MIIAPFPAYCTVQCESGNMAMQSPKRAVLSEGILCHYGCTAYPSDGVCILPARLVQHKTAALHDQDLRYNFSVAVVSYDIAHVSRWTAFALKVLCKSIQ